MTDGTKAPAIPQGISAAAVEAEHSGGIESSGTTVLHPQIAVEEGEQATNQRRLLSFSADGEQSCKPVPE